MIRIIFLLFMHIAADFLLQGNSMSKLKMTKISFLFAHAGIYTALFIALSPFLLALTFTEGLVYSLINGVAHLLVDFVTTRFKKVYWEKDETKYIMTISLDHLVHLSILILTYIYMYPAALNASVILD
jgi:hypothetical protein